MVPPRRFDRRRSRLSRFRFVVVFPSWFVAAPAAADGFNFLCEAPGPAGGGGGGGGPSEFEQLATGMATKIITDQALWLFHAYRCRRAFRLPFRAR